MKFPREVHWDGIQPGDRIRFVLTKRKGEEYVVECRVAAIDRKAKTIQTPAGEIHKFDTLGPFVLLGRGLPAIVTGRRYRVTTFYGATVIESNYIMMKDGVGVGGRPETVLYFRLTESPNCGFAIPFDCVATMEEVQPAL